MSSATRRLRKKIKKEYDQSFYVRFSMCMNANFSCLFPYREE